ncbi:MAG: galactokinase [Lawsonella sp.]
MSSQDSTIAAAEAAKLFQEVYGYEPAGVWSAPGRVNVIGEHVDYAGGLCLPFAINRRTFCAAAPRNDGVIRLQSALPQYDKMSTWEGKLSDIGPGKPKSWPAYPAGVVWTMWQDAQNIGVDLSAETGFDMVFLSDVPLGAGLSSSAAIELSVACAVFDLQGPGLDSLPTDRLDQVSDHIIAACIRAENEVVGASTGGLDQSASFRGQGGNALELDMGEGTTQQVPFDLSAHDLAILVIDTNAPHNLGDGQYGSRRAIVDRVMEGLDITAPHREKDLVKRAVEWSKTQPEADDKPKKQEKWFNLVERRMRHIVTESRRTASLVDALKQGILGDEQGVRNVKGLQKVGGLMLASHESLRDDYEVSCPELDSAVEAAMEAGAWGARMTGGGFGGSAIALVDVDDVPKVEAAVLEAARTNKLTTPDFLVAVPSPGARRDL